MTHHLTTGVITNSDNRILTTSSNSLICGSISCGNSGNWSKLDHPLKTKPTFDITLSKEILDIKDNNDEYIVLPAISIRDMAKRLKTLEDLVSLLISERDQKELPKEYDDMKNQALPPKEEEEVNKEFIQSLDI